MTNTAPARPDQQRNLFDNRLFVTLWATQGITQTAQNVINFSLLVLAQSLTGSSTSVGLMILAFSVPAVLFSSVAGVLVDRWDKRVVMAGSNLVRGLAVASYMLVEGPGDLPKVYLAAFLFATAAQFFSPAEGALIPRLVGTRSLIAANSLYNLTLIAAQFLGFTVVGWLMIRTLGLHRVFLVISVLYLVAAALIIALPLPRMKAGEAGATGRHFWTELTEGWRFIARRRVLLVTMVHLSVANSMYLLLGTLGPAYVSTILKIRPADLGLLLSPAGLFTLVGIAAVHRLARPDNRHVMVHWGLVGAGAAILGLSLTDPLSKLLASLTAVHLGTTALTVMAVPFSMLLGFSTSFVTIPAQTVLQENSGDEIRGRVLATFFAVSNAVAFFPILMAGAVADLLGILETFGIVGGFILAIGVMSQMAYVRTNGTWGESSEVA